MIKQFILLCLIFAEQIVSEEVAYPKIIHNTDPQAKCLDGSSPALYIHQGNQPTKFIIFVQGGGYCKGLTQGQVIEDCYQRSKTYLGSSTLWPDTLIAGGYLSTDPQKSKFAEWTKIMIAYCDGSFHQGHRDQPIPYKGTNLFFRGQKIMRSQLSYIQKHFKLSKATQVVWTGSSAGAVASLIWMEKIKQIVADRDIVYTIPDSGVLLDFPTFDSNDNEFIKEVQTLYKISNLDTQTPFQLCNIYFSNEPWKCLFVQYNHQYLFGKILFIQSQYDSVVIRDILKIPCGRNKTQGGQTLSSCNESEMNYIEKYRYEYQKLMINIMQRPNNFAYWDIACSNHVYACLDTFYQSDLQKAPTNTGLTLRKAVQIFVLSQGTRILASDALPYPYNSLCS